MRIVSIEFIALLLVILLCKQSRTQMMGLIMVLLFLPKTRYRKHKTGRIKSRFTFLRWNISCDNETGVGIEKNSSGVIGYYSLLKVVLWF